MLVYLGWVNLGNWLVICVKIVICFWYYSLIWCDKYDWVVYC